MHTPVSVWTIVQAPFLCATFMDTPLSEPALGEPTLLGTALVAALTTAIGTPTQQPGTLLLQLAFLIVFRRPRGCLGLNRPHVSDGLAHG